MKLNLTDREVLAIKAVLYAAGMNPDTENGWYFNSGERISFSEAIDLVIEKFYTE